MNRILPLAIAFLSLMTFKSEGQVYGVSFDGSEDYIECPNDSTLTLTHQITLECWVKSNVSSTGSYEEYILRKQDMYVGGYWLFFSAPNHTFCFHLTSNTKNTDRVIDSHIAPEPGKWYHYAGTYDGNIQKVYVNGQLIDSLYWNGEIVGSEAPLLIAAQGDNYHSTWLNGVVDELRIWNIARTQNEIQGTMYTLLTGNEPGLMAYYNYNEGNGFIAHDATGNNNDGTLYNDAQWVLGINEISITSLSNTGFLPGDPINVDFTVMQPFDEGNTFSLQLSRGGCDFSNPLTLGSVYGITNGTISGIIPADVLQGCSYRLRIVADNPGHLGGIFPTDISILNDITDPGDYMTLFDGVDGYIDLGTWFDRSNFTLSFWVNPDSIQQPGAAIADIQNGLVLCSNPNMQGNYILTDGLQFDLLPNKWNHITITHSSNGANDYRKVYLFGQLIAEMGYVYYPMQGYNFRLGNSRNAWPNSHFKGMIDEIKLWDTIISPEQIVLNMNKKLTGNEEGLVGYWDFNNGCSRVAPDLTPNHHDGTLVQGAVKMVSTVPNIGHQIIPNKAGNTDICTISIYGDLFQRGTITKLSGNSHPEIPADTTVINADGSMATCLFDLAGKETGIYDVVIINPDGTEKLYKDSFTIEEGIPAEVWIDIIGNSAVRRGMPYNFLVTYGNNGNVDAKGVLLFVLVPKSVDISLGFIPLSPDSTLIFSDSLSFYCETDSLDGIPYPAKIIPLFIPRIPPNTVNALKFTLFNIPNSPFEIQAWIDDGLYESALNGSVLKSALGSCLNTVIKEITGIFPYQDCIYWASDMIMAPIVENFITLYDPGDKKPIYNQTGKNPVSYALILMETVILSSTNCFPQTCTADLVMKMIKWLAQWVSLQSLSIDCNFYTPVCIQKITVKPIYSCDPNSKTGPQKYCHANTSFNYLIQFENVDTASAPAQEVTIIDTLDRTKFDLNTYSFGYYGFGDTLSEGTYQYDREFLQFIDLRPGTELIVKTEGELNTTKGIARWKFTSLDPATMELTTDPLLGFLPPDDSTGRGEGWVSFNIRPKSTLATGTNIENSATIIFDFNNPILTNIYTNSIDDIRPLSHVNPINASPNDSNFVVSWIGSDIGSGIKYYDVYLSEDTADFFPWIYHAASTSATFHGHSKHYYRFFSLAIDSANNIENDTLPIVSISLTGTAELTVNDHIVLYQNYPNPFSDFTTIEYYLPKSQKTTLIITDMCGKVLETIENASSKQGFNKIIFLKNYLSPGIYLYKLIAGQNLQIKMMVVN